MKRNRTIQLYDGKWHTLHADYWHECCQCGSVHAVTTKVDGTHLFQRWTFSEYQTRKARRQRVMSETNKD